MQTFLPYADFRDSAACLDRQRLGKQRSESKIIVRSLMGLYDKGKGWAHHPAVKMWEGHVFSLCQYSIAICEEWRARGYKDKCLPWFIAAKYRFGRLDRSPPPWLGDERVHRSHRANLIRKLPDHYGPLWPDVSAEISYLWPVGEEWETTPASDLRHR